MKLFLPWGFQGVSKIPLGVSNTNQGDSTAKNPLKSKLFRIIPVAKISADFLYARLPEDNERDEIVSAVPLESSAGKSVTIFAGTHIHGTLWAFRPVKAKVYPELACAINW